MKVDLLTKQFNPKSTNMLNKNKVKQDKSICLVNMLNFTVCFNHEWTGAKKIILANLKTGFYFHFYFSVIAFLEPELLKNLIITGKKVYKKKKKRKERTKYIHNASLPLSSNLSFTFSKNN